MRLISRLKQVLNHVESKVKELAREHAERRRLRRYKDQDSTIEDQAQSFRIWMWSSAFALTLIVIFTVISNSRAQETVNTADTTPSFLEQLPEGFVVAPIEPTNSEPLDSIFDDHGYADLYRANVNGEKGKRIARGLALIRAPRNPRQFAVIVPESQTDLLPELSQPVVVILRKGPPKTPEKRADKKKAPKRESRSKVEIIAEDAGDWHESTMTAKDSEKGI